MQRMKSRHGLAVVLVICSLAALFGLAASILVLSGGGLQLALTHQQVEQARFAAEGGIAWGVDYCSLHGTLPSNPCARDMENPGQSFVLTTYDNRAGSAAISSFPGGPQVPPHCMYLVSEGLFRGKHAQKEGCMVHVSDGPFQVGALAPHFYFKPGSTIDAFDSRLGGYGPASLVANANLLATNENDQYGGLFNFDSDDGTDIPVAGKAFVGPSGDFDRQIRPNVHPSAKAHLPAQLPMPEVELPTGLPIYGNVRASNSQVQTLSPGSYSEVKARSGGTIKLTSGTYIFERLDIHAGQLQVEGACTVYVTRYFHAETNGAIVNTTERAKNLKFIYTRAADGTDEDRPYIAGGAQAYFTLLATKTMVDVVDNSHIYGSIVAGKGIEFSAPGHFHYDVSLASESGGSGSLSIINRHSL